MKFAFRSLLSSFESASVIESNSTMTNAKQQQFSANPASPEAPSLSSFEDAPATVQTTSSRWIGIFNSRLKTLQHPGLCQYLDLVQASHKHFFLISEYYTDTLSDLVRGSDTQTLPRYLFQLLSTIDYLQSRGINCGCLSSRNVRLDDQGNVKLIDYGLHVLTAGGSESRMPLQPSLSFVAPEVFSLGLSRQSGFQSKLDVWHFGRYLLEIFASPSPHQFLDPSKLAHAIARLHDRQIASMIESCMHVQLHMRPTIRELLSNPFFKTGDTCFTPTARNPIFPLTSVDAYSLWRISGGDIVGAWRRTFRKDSRKSLNIDDLPKFIKTNGFIRLESNSFGSPECQFDLMVIDASETLKAITLDLDRRADNSLGKTSGVIDFWDGAWEPMENRFRDIECTMMPVPEDVTWISVLGQMKQTAEAEFGVRERDLSYQFGRMVFFRSLMEHVHSNSTIISSEAKLDVPLTIRGEVWKLLLGVEEIETKALHQTDFQSFTETDRQLDVDIPRCHQYHPMLRCLEGQARLKYLLKAWLVANPDLVYWQGLDSICAVFLTTFFSDECLAFACFQKFTRKFLVPFFAHDNSRALKMQLHSHKRLLAFHDAELYSHLRKIGFNPELYAISWFLTWFTHVFPINTTLRLWTLMLALPHRLSFNFNLLLSIVLMKTLRKKILNSDFNECMSCFGDVATTACNELLAGVVSMGKATPAGLFNTEAFDELGSIHLDEYLARHAVWTVLDSKKDDAHGHFRGSLGVGDESDFAILESDGYYAIVTSDALEARKIASTLVNDYHVSRVAFVHDVSLDKEKRVMSFFQQNFQFRAPYQVLVDGTFLHFALSRRIDMREFIPRAVHGPCKLLITPCIQKELVSLGEEFAASAFAAKKRLEHRACHHPEAISSRECIKSLIGSGNKHHFVVATQDTRLRSDLRSRPGVPLVYINQVVVILEQPSGVSIANAKSSQHKKTLPESFEAPKIQPAVVAAAPLPKKKKTHQPNPLSCKRKKRDSPTSSSGSEQASDDGEKKKRRRPRRGKNVNADENNA